MQQGLLKLPCFRAQDACHSYVIFEIPEIAKKGTYSAKIYPKWLKCKSATLGKYGGKLKIGGPKISVRMCGVIFFWTAGEDPG